MFRVLLGSIPIYYITLAVTLKSNAAPVSIIQIKGGEITSTNFCLLTSINQFFRSFNSGFGELDAYHQYIV